MSVVRYTKEEFNEKFKDKLEAEIQCLVVRGKISDKHIDLSDIPEITNWSKAIRHGQRHHPLK